MMIFNYLHFILCNIYCIGLAFIFLRIAHTPSLICFYEDYIESDICLVDFGFPNGYGLLLPNT
jgi:hypothetical protein